MKSGQTAQDDLKRELIRFHAQLRHLTRVAAGTLIEATRLQHELWEACQDPRTPEQIIDGVDFSEADLPVIGWPEFLEKLHRLGQLIDYSRRLCDGSIEQEQQPDKEEIS